MYLTFAWRYFKAKKSTHAINIIARVTTGVIAFATCCQILVLSVFNGFEDLVRSLYSSFYADLSVQPTRGKTFTLTAAQIEKIQKQSFVAGISMIAEEKALLKNEENQVVISVKGVDSNYTRVSGLPQKIFTGRFEIGTAEDPMLVVGEGVRQAAGIFSEPSVIPQTLTLILPQARSTAFDPLDVLSEGNLRPSGVFSIQQEFDNNYALTNIDFIKNQLHLRADEFSSADIKLTEDANPEACQQDLQALLGNKYAVITKYQQNSSLYNTMKLEKWAIFAILTLILIIAAFNMISALTMLVLEKKQDIQVLKSMGAGDNKLRGIFLTEGLLLGVIGTLTGILLATIICQLQLKYHLIKLMGGAFLIDYFPVKMLLSDFALVALTAIVISLLASWIPAHKASRQPFQLR